MVPPWVDPLPNGDIVTQESEAVNAEIGNPDVAPPRRFRDARVALGRFTQSGDKGQLRRSLGHYVTHGYGGAQTATRRMSRTAQTAGRLGDVLERLAGFGGLAALDLALTSSTDVDVILDAIVEATRPVDGTLDAETSRLSIYEAIADLLTEFPEADLLSLDDTQRRFVIERYVALDVFNLFCRDMMRTVMAKATDHLTGLARLDQIRSYIKEVVAASFRNLQEQGKSPTSSTAAEFVRQALGDTFAVFEEYLT